MYARAYTQGGQKNVVDGFPHGHDARTGPVHVPRMYRARAVRTRACEGIVRVLIFCLPVWGRGHTREAVAS